MPVIIGNIQNQEEYSKNNNGKILWTLELPVKMPEKGWRVPTELGQFSEFLVKCSEYEKSVNYDYDKTYAYISVDQRPADPHASQRRTGWHGDSYIAEKSGEVIRTQSGIEMDSIYTCYDCLPTLFCPGPFDFEANKIDGENKQQVLDLFDRKAGTLPHVVYPNYSILRFGPECVHSVSLNNTNDIVQRTFVKLVFSQYIYNRLGNDHNYLFNYQWKMHERSDDYNSRNNSTLL